jgi:serine/threonine protein kinase
MSSVGEGTVINARFEIRRKLGSGGMGDVFLAYDRHLQHEVALKLVRQGARMRGDEELMRQETRHALAVAHRHVCRVHDLTTSPYGPIIVMEYVPGETLHRNIQKKEMQKIHQEDEFRRIAMDVASGLAAIHAEGVVHGDLKPGNVMVNPQRVVILDFGFAHERARMAASLPGAAPDGGTPNYMSPQRLRSGGASAEDDVYALGLTLWEMWTGYVPEPGAEPRQTPMKAQIASEIPSRLCVDEIKQVWCCLSPDPQTRPAARRLKFFKPSTLTTSAVPRERLQSGPRPGPAAAQQFVPGAQGLLVTHASHAPDAVGQLFPLTQPTVRIGRHAGQDIVVPEATVSGAHAVLEWHAGQWIADDLGSTNGTFAEYDDKPMSRVVLLHGNELQLGELRLKLVSFAPDSSHHQRAKAFLARRDGLTGLLRRPYLEKDADDEAAFAEWADFPLTVARYQLSGPNRMVSERPGIREILALRTAARRAVEQTEHLLLSLWPVVAGLAGPLRFAVLMVGPSLEESQQIVEQVTAQVRQTLPGSIELSAEVIRAKPGARGGTFFE